MSEHDKATNGQSDNPSTERSLNEGAPKSFAQSTKPATADGADNSNRAERRARRADGVFDQDAFLALAGRFIEQANRANRKIDARNVQMAMIWATARYSAHVGKNVRGIEEHEPFVDDMMRHFAEGLRQNLADPKL